MKTRYSSTFAVCALVATCSPLLSACTGEVLGGGAADGASGPQPSSGGASSAGGAAGASNAPPFEPAAGMLRRLTRAQFRNSVRDVFGVEVDVGELDPDSWNGNFATIGAASVATAERGVEQYHTAVEKAVSAVFGDETKRAAFIGCTPSLQPGDGCVRSFIAGMGLRAWRRPLEAAETTRLTALAESSGSKLGSAVEGLRWVTVALFTSPHFLYRAELGAPRGDGKLRFSGYEMASRLAFLIRNSAPERALLDDARDGALGAADGIRKAAERLLDSPPGREAVGEFAEQYMRLDRVSAQAKDATLFPEYGPALQAGMVRDMRGTWETLVLDERVSVLELFSTTKVVANAELAKLYGLDATGLDASTFKVLTLPADGPRLGILGKAGFLSQFSNQKEGSPTLRGKFIRDALMCKSIPPPPGDVNAMLEEPPADKPMTKRDQLELHRRNPQCAGCHSLMDPLGLPLETFDAIGRYRTQEHGLAIDPSGDFDGQPLAGARELGIAMSTSHDVARCLVSRYYTYAVGHEERAVDGSVLDSLATSFEASGFQLRELILSTVAHEAFSSVAAQP